MNYKNTIKKSASLFVVILISSSFISLSNDNHNPPEDTIRTQFTNNKLSVFLDAQGWADEDYIRQEIPVVNYVRDKELADVHIIISRHDVGQAGTSHIISFIGRREFKGMENELTYWAPSSQTDYETREGCTKMIKIGMAPYIANVKNMADIISLQFDADSLPDMEAGQTEAEDPWNRWIFEIYAGGFFESEQTRNSTQIRYGFFADKITENWKIRARPYFNYYEDNYEIEDSIISNIRHRDGFDGYLIKSITDHWSAGVFTDIRSSTYDNIDFQVKVSPAIEYSLFPYKEATRRSIAIAYKLDYSYNDYEKETIFGQKVETLWGHSVVVSADFRQTWGSIRAGITGSQHFHDLSSTRAELFSRLDLRIFKGFSLTLEGEFDFINDLVAIPMGKMTTEEILLEQRRRSTNYQVEGHIGFTYTFGSELSGEYNPRL